MPVVGTPPTLGDGERARARRAVAPIDRRREIPARRRVVYPRSLKVTPLSAKVIPGRSWSADRDRGRHVGDVNRRVIVGVLAVLGGDPPVDDERAGLGQQVAGTAAVAFGLPAISKVPSL